MDRIEEAIAWLTSNQLSLIATQNTMSLKLDELLQKMANLETQPHSPFTSTTPPQNPIAPHTPRMKLEAPKFDGYEPLRWIFKINQFFEYHSTPDSDHLTLASFSMEGPALPWF